MPSPDHTLDHEDALARAYQAGHDETPAEQAPAAPVERLGVYRIDSRTGGPDDVDCESVIVVAKGPASALAAAMPMGFERMVRIDDDDTRVLLPPPPLVMLPPTLLLLTAGDGTVLGVACSRAALAHLIDEDNRKTFLAPDEDEKETRPHGYWVATAPRFGKLATISKCPAFGGAQ